MRTDAPAVTRGRRRVNLVLVWLIGAWLALVGIVVVGIIALDRRDQRRSQEICGIIRLLDDRNQRLPPSPDPDAVSFRAELHRYRLALGCR